MYIDTEVCKFYTDGHPFGITHTRSKFDDVLETFYSNTKDSMRACAVRQMGIAMKTPGKNNQGITKWLRKNRKPTPWEKASEPTKAQKQQSKKAKRRANKAKKAEKKAKKAAQKAAKKSRKERKKARQEAEKQAKIAKAQAFVHPSLHPG